MLLLPAALLARLSCFGQVFNYNFSYNSNYSLAAALVSRVTSINLRQMNDYLRYLELEIPFEIAILQENHLPGYENFVINNTTLVCCKLFDGQTGRWISQGVINSGKVKYVEERVGSWHVCLAYLTASFSLVLIENPTASLPIYQSWPSLSELINYNANSLYPFFIIFVHLIICTVVFMQFSSKAALEWRDREINAMLIEGQPQFEAGGKNVDHSSKGVIHNFISFPIPILLHSKVIAGHFYDEARVFGLHLHKCLCCWHYLYAWFILELDGIQFLQRSSSLISLSIASFTINCYFLSQTDVGPSNWYFAMFKTAVILCPLAQVFPVVFRKVSKGPHLSESILRYNKIQPSPAVFQENIPSNGTSIGRTRIKHLKQVLGDDVIKSIKENASVFVSDPSFELENDNTRACQDSRKRRNEKMLDLDDCFQRTDKGDSSESNENLKVYKGDISESHENLKVYSTNDSDTRSLKFFLKNKIFEATCEKSDKSEESNLLISGNQDDRPEKGCNQGTALCAGGLSGTYTPATAEAIGNFVSSPRQEANLKSFHFLTQAEVFGSENLNDPKMAKSKICYPENRPPPPPMQLAEPLPDPPPGKQPASLGVVGERKLWRSLRIHELEQEAPFFESRARKFVLQTVMRMGDDDWGKLNRQEVPFVLPQSFLRLVCSFWVLWLVFCFIVISTIAVHFDNEIGSVWIFSSIISLCFELLVSQTILSTFFAWWASSLGKPSLVHNFHWWASERSDLLPPFG